jgi:hypothetical protein
MQRDRKAVQMPLTTAPRDIRDSTGSLTGAERVTVACLCTRCHANLALAAAWSSSGPALS